MTTTEAEHITVEEHERRMRTFRAKVRDEAMKMAVEHSLCDEVERTLKRAGISSEYQMVTVTIMTSRTMEVRVPSDLIANYSESALQSAFQQWDEGNMRTSEERAWRQVETIEDEEERAITSFEVHPVGEATIQWKYLWDGKAAHAVPTSNGFPHDEALCGQAVNVYGWRDHSNRGDGRCQRCVKANH